MGTQNAPTPIQVPLRILNMDVIDTFGKLLDKGSRVQKLRNKMAWVKINTKARAVADSIQRLARCHKIIRNFSGMDFQRKLHAFLLKYIYNRVPAFGKLLVSSLDFLKVVRRERVEQIPDT